MKVKGIEEKINRIISNTLPISDDRYAELTGYRDEILEEFHITADRIERLEKTIDEQREIIRGHLKTIDDLQHTNNYLKNLVQAAKHYIKIDVDEWEANAKEQS